MLKTKTQNFPPFEPFLEKLKIKPRIYMA